MYDNEDDLNAAHAAFVAKMLSERKEFFQKQFRKPLDDLEAAVGEVLPIVWDKLAAVQKTKAKLVTLYEQQHGSAHEMESGLDEMIQGVFHRAQFCSEELPFVLSLSLTDSPRDNHAKAPTAAMTPESLDNTEEEPVASRQGSPDLGMPPLPPVSAAREKRPLGQDAEPSPQQAQTKKQCRPGEDHQPLFDSIDSRPSIPAAEVCGIAFVAECPTGSGRFCVIRCDVCGKYIHYDFTSKMQALLNHWKWSDSHPTRYHMVDDVYMNCMYRVENVDKTWCIQSNADLNLQDRKYQASKGKATSRTSRGRRSHGSRKGDPGSSHKRPYTRRSTQDNASRNRFPNLFTGAHDTKSPDGTSAEDRPNLTAEDVRPFSSFNNEESQKLSPGLGPDLGDIDVTLDDINAMDRNLDEWGDSDSESVILVESKYLKYMGVPGEESEEKVIKIEPVEMT